ncbi:hypothetical protein D3C76_1081700 [compost metagenome]
MRQIVGTYRLQGGVFIRFANQLVTHCQQGVAIRIAGRHQLKGKAVALTEAVDGRRRHGEHGGIANAAQLFAGAQGDRLGSVFAALTLGPVFQRHKRHPGVLAAAAEAESFDGEDHVGVVFLFAEEPVGDLTAYLGGAHGSRTRGQGVLHHYFALIFRRQEAARQFPHRQGHRAAQDREDRHHAAGAA